MDAVDSKAPALYRVVRGQGPVVVFIHGSAADHATWSTQLASSLRQEATLIAYDRRGTGRSVGGAKPSDPASVGASATAADEAAPLQFDSVATHAADAAALIEVQGGAPVVVVGSSFGAVVAIELLLERSELVRHAVLCEPPLSPVSGAFNVPAGFLQHFDRLVNEAGGEAAGEFFLRTVLTDAAFERIPTVFRGRSVKLWREIRADSEALLRYQFDYARLRSIRTPVTIVAGERSAPYFRPTVEALVASIPTAKQEVMRGAGHMMHAEARRQFAALLRAVIA